MAFFEEYRCIGLASGAILLLLAGCTSSTTSVTLDYYQVSGNSIQQIDQQIRDNGPRIDGNKHAVAVASIKMIPDIVLSSRPNGCVISRARIKVKAIVTLPRWNDRTGADAKLVRTWENLDRYTRLHEAVHVSIAGKYARQIELELKTLKTGKTCAETRDIAGALIDETMKKHEIEQQEFDESEKAKFAKLTKS